MSNDRYGKIRKALANGRPTPESWAQDIDTIRELLDERDKLEAENERLRAEVERFRFDGASAVRWAPYSAYWSEVLKELFGPHARDGIDELERQWRAALERANTAEARHGLKENINALRENPQSTEDGEE